MNFDLNINMDNAAFEVMPERELAALLRVVANELLAGKVEANTYDTNGNKVGTWEIECD